LKVIISTRVNPTIELSSGRFLLNSLEYKANASTQSKMQHIMIQCCKYGFEEYIAEGPEINLSEYNSKHNLGLEKLKKYLKNHQPEILVNIGRKQRYLQHL
jgi:hypothetical protein